MSDNETMKSNNGGMHQRVSQEMISEINTANLSQPNIKKNSSTLSKAGPAGAMQLSAEQIQSLSNDRSSDNSKGRDSAANLNPPGSTYSKVDPIKIDANIHITHNQTPYHGGERSTLNDDTSRSLDPLSAQVPKSHGTSFQQSYSSQKKTSFSAA